MPHSRYVQVKYTKPTTPITPVLPAETAKCMPEYISHENKSNIDACWLLSGKHVYAVLLLHIGEWN